MMFLSVTISFLFMMSLQGALVVEAGDFYVNDQSWYLENFTDPTAAFHIKNCSHITMLHSIVSSIYLQAAHNGLLNRSISYTFINNTILDTLLIKATTHNAQPVFWNSFECQIFNNTMAIFLFSPYASPTNPIPNITLEVLNNTIVKYASIARSMWNPFAVTDSFFLVRGNRIITPNGVSGIFPLIFTVDAQNKSLVVIQDNEFFEYVYECMMFSGGNKLSGNSTLLVERNKCLMSYVRFATMLGDHSMGWHPFQLGDIGSTIILRENSFRQQILFHVVGTTEQQARKNSTGNCFVTFCNNSFEAAEFLTGTKMAGNSGVLVLSSGNWNSKTGGLLLLDKVWVENMSSCADNSTAQSLMAEIDGIMPEIRVPTLSISRSISIETASASASLRPTTATATVIPPQQNKQSSTVSPFLFPASSKTKEKEKELSRTTTRSFSHVGENEIFDDNLTRSSSTSMIIPAVSNLSSTFPNNDTFPSSSNVVDPNAIVLNTVLGSETMASVVVAASASATVLTVGLTGAITAPSQAIRGTAIVRAALCRWLEDGGGPSLLDHPIQLPIFNEGTLTTAKYSSGMVCSTLICLVCWILSAIACRPVASHSRCFRAFQKVSSILTVMSISLLVPSIHGSSMMIFLHSSVSVELVAAVICSIISFLGYIIFLYVIVKRFHVDVELVNKKSGSTSSTTTAVSMQGDPQITESEKSKMLSGFFFPSERYVLAFRNSASQTNISRYPALVPALQLLFEDAKDVSQTILRLYFFEDTISAWLLAVVSNIIPKKHSSCVPIAIALLIFTVIHLGYLLYWRPYRTRLNLIFALIFALNSCVMAFLVLIQAQLSILGILVLVQSASFLLQLIFQSFWVYYTIQRRKTQNRLSSGPTNFDSSTSTADIEMKEQPLLQLPDASSAIAVSNPLEAKSE